ncbi:HNH endonuclease signature motif containing protein [Streptomyces sp. NPDC006283]|uniref:HNH endonuclease signature motif containing protein n=1 Tax=Streptomyces sp. NPDC006283 TaxID=3156741 RepID=UPI0033A0B053
MARSPYTRERLAEAATSSRTLSEALVKLRVDPKSPTRRGRTRNRRTPQTLLVAQEPGTARRVPSERLKQAMAALGVRERCAGCGTEPLWRGRPLPLEVDHVDGNWRNNRPDNLRLLCPNCHSSTDTYRGRSKGRRNVASREAGAEA